MKKLLFALPVLAIAMLFAYCDRPSIQEELSSVNPNASTDRATCLVQIDRASPTAITLCGTNTNATNCASCTGGKAQGTVNIPAGVNPFFITLTTPIEFSISTATGNSVVLTTAAGQIVVDLTSVFCKTVRIDANCAATVL